MRGITNKKKRLAMVLGRIIAYRRLIKVISNALVIVNMADHTIEFNKKPIVGYLTV
ncbi:hypothetical protein DSUL_50313 [Desulfovibrionales bacterium]